MTTNRISISFAQSVQSVTSVIEHFSEVCLRRMLLSFSSLLNNSRFQRLCVSVVSLRPRASARELFRPMLRFLRLLLFKSVPVPGTWNDLHQANKDNEEFWGRTAVGRCCGAANGASVSPCRGVAGAHPGFRADWISPSPPQFVEERAGERRPF